MLPISAANAISTTPNRFWRGRSNSAAGAPKARAGAGLGEEFGDLDGVEGGALAQVVVADEQREAASVRDAGILTYSTHERRIRAGRVKRVRHVHHGDTRGIGQQGERAID